MNIIEFAMLKKMFGKGGGGGVVVKPITVLVYDQDYCGPYEITYTNIRGEQVTETVPVGGNIEIVAPQGTFVTIDSSVGSSFSGADLFKDSTLIDSYDFSINAIELPTDIVSCTLIIMG